MRLKSRTATSCIYGWPDDYSYPKLQLDPAHVCIRMQLYRQIGARQIREIVCRELQGPGWTAPFDRRSKRHGQDERPIMGYELRIL